MIDNPASPTWTHAGVPTPTLTQADEERAARMCHRYARTPAEAEDFVSMLGLGDR